MREAQNYMAPVKGYVGRLLGSIHHICVQLHGFIPALPCLEIRRPQAVPSVIKQEIAPRGRRILEAHDLSDRDSNHLERSQRGLARLKAQRGGFFVHDPRNLTAILCKLCATGEAIGQFGRCAIDVETSTRRL